MARKPNTKVAAAVPVPEFAVSDESSVPTRRGRRPKAPAPAPSPALLPAAGTGDPFKDDVEADVPEVVPTKTPGRRDPGREQRQAAGAEAAAPPSGTAVEQASAEASPSAAGPEQTSAEGGTLVGEMALPPDAAGVDDAGHGGTHLDEASPGDVLSSTAPAKTARAAPAMRWDRATDAVEFDWPEIEQAASRNGPNQAMAKLLVAARAEGAASRWPL